MQLQVLVGESSVTITLNELEADPHGFVSIPARKSEDARRKIDHLCLGGNFEECLDKTLVGRVRFGVVVPVFGAVKFDNEGMRHAVLRSVRGNGCMAGEADDNADLQPFNAVIDSSLARSNICLLRRRMYAPILQSEHVIVDLH